MKLFLKMLGVYLAFLGQSIIFENIKILSCSPDILIVAIIICAVSSDMLKAALIGGFAGLLTDVMCANIFGLNTLIYMYLAIIVSCIVSDRIQNSPLLMGWTVFSGIVIYEVLLTLLKTMFGYSVSVAFLGANILVKGLFGAIFALLFVIVSQKIKAYNERRKSSFKEEQV